MKVVGVKATTTMTKTLYIEVPDEYSDVDIINKAKEEIIPPQNALGIADKTLKSINIKINKLDLDDWEVLDYSIKQI